MATRKIKITPERAEKIYKSLSTMKVALDVAIVENSYYLDANFKNPIIHHKLNTATKNIQDVTNFLTSKYLIPTDDSEEVTFVLHEFIQLAQNLNKFELEELIKGIKEIKNINN